VVLSGRGLAGNAPNWLAHEGAAPERETGLGGAFVTDTIDSSDVDPIGQRVTPLDELPGLILCGAEFSFFARVPADGRRIEEDIRTLQRREAGSLGIPLIPADQDAKAAVSTVEDSETEITRCKIIFLE